MTAPDRIQKLLTPISEVPDSHPLKIKVTKPIESQKLRGEKGQA